jgi:endonuclease/exonuclease/phosphatase (EEP) superfamily protein YafD
MRPLTLLALAAALAATAAVFFSDHWWPFELAGHFRLHLIAASALFAIVALWRGPRWAALGLAGVAAWHAVEVSRIPFAPAAPAAAAAGPKVATVNLLWNNRSHDAVIAFLNRTDADIVVLQETTTVWSRALTALKPRYPHRYPDETQAHPGVLVLSKTPLLPNGLQVPYVAAMRVRWRDGSLLFLGVHTVLPFGEQGRAIQAKTLADIADLAARETGPVIVAGDFNHTAYTPRFARLLERGKLAPSRHPGIWPVTWRAAFADVPGLDRLFGLPIDQVLMSRHFAVRAVTIGPEVGSDHLPVVVELALRP